MTTTNVFVILLKNFLRIGLAKNDDEVNVATHRIVSKVVTVLRGLNEHTMSIFKVNDMI